MYRVRFHISMNQRPHFSNRMLHWCWLRCGSSSRGMSRQRSLNSTPDLPFLWDFYVCGERLVARHCVLLPCCVRSARWHDVAWSMRHGPAWSDSVVSYGMAWNYLIRVVCYGIAFTWGDDTVGNPHWELNFINSSCWVVRFVDVIKHQHTIT